jgi:hypothetical protein
MEDGSWKDTAGILGDAFIEPIWLRQPSMSY